MRPPLCMWCKRYDRESFPASCESFPRGIPDDIFDGRLSHLLSMRGEVPFDGTIPVGYETLAESLDDEWFDVDVSEVVQSGVDESRPQDATARGWTPARRVG
jgi:hypothetical protein